MHHFLAAHFGEVEIQDLKPLNALEALNGSSPKLLVHCEPTQASVDVLTLVSSHIRSLHLFNLSQEVTCENDSMRSRVRRVVQMAITTIDSLHESFGLSDKFSMVEMNAISSNEATDIVFNEADQEHQEITPIEDSEVKMNPEISVAQ